MTQIPGGDGASTQGTGSSTLPPAVGAAAAHLAADFPRRATDAVQLVVDTIHDKAVRPAVLIARAIVFGLVVTTLASVMMIVASLAVLRLFDVYVFTHRVWLSYVVLGGALTLAGLAAWSRRTVRSAR